MSRMMSVQSKGAGSLKLPRGRASRLGRVSERPRLARERHRPAECSFPSLFPPPPQPLSSGSPCLLRTSSIYLPVNHSQRLASGRNSGSQKQGGAPRLDPQIRLPEKVGRKSIGRGRKLRVEFRGT